MTALQTRVLTAAQLDEIRIAAGRATENAIAAAFARHGQSPQVLATAVEGIITGATVACWQKRNPSIMSPRRFKVTLRAILNRAVSFVTKLP